MRAAVLRPNAVDSREWGLAAAGFLTLAVVLILPRWSVGLLPFLVIAWGLALRPPVDGRAVLFDDPVKWAFALFMAYLVVNASWALDRPDAYLRVALLALFLAVSFVALHWAERAGERHVAVLAAALGSGAVVGVVLLAAEVASGRALSGVLFEWAPALRPRSERHMWMLDELNRNVGLLMLAFWPIVLILRRLKNARARLIALPLFLTGTAVAVLLSAHMSSRIALVAGAITFLGMQWLPRLTRHTVMALWCAAFLLVVPVSLAAYQVGLHTASWLPASGQARIILWSHTAVKIAERPLLGIGVRSTMIYDALNRPHVIQPDDHAFPLHTGRHAHNIYLQSWFEMGLVGAAFMLAIGVLVLRRLAGLAPPAQRYVYAQFVTFMAVGGATWGLWQSWYQAGIALAAVVMALAVARTRHTD